MGREQAAHQGKILDRVISDWSAVDIYSSPQGRAKLTEIALAGVNRTADLHAALREVDTGDWAGLHISDIIDADPRMAKPYTLNGLAPISHPRMGRDMKFSKPACWRFIVLAKADRHRHPWDGWICFAWIIPGLTFEQMAGQVGGQGVVFHLSDGRETVLKD